MYYKDPLNYSGNKYKLLSQLQQVFPEKINKFIDVFAGAGCVALNTKANRYLLNDRNFYTINLLKMMRDFDTYSLLGIIDFIVQEHNLSKENKERFLKLREYYNLSPLQEWDTLSENTIDKYLVLYCLITHSFNYQQVYTKDWKFSVPSGAGRSYFNPKLRKRFIDYCNILQEKKPCLVSKDYRNILNFVLKNSIESDLVFVDPPYAITTDLYSRSNFLKWTKKDEVELYEYLSKLNEKGIRFCLTNMWQKGSIINKHLDKFIENYKVISVNNTFSNCSYQKLTENKCNVEIIVTNYEL